MITQAEIQVILLMTSMTYFFIGNTLEYVRNVEIKIIVPLIAFFGILKIFVRSFLLLFYRSVSTTSSFSKTSRLLCVNLYSSCPLSPLSD